MYHAKDQMSEAANFKSYAAQCRAAARSAIDPRARATWLEMEQDWLSFAAKTDAKTASQQQQQIDFEIE